MSRYENAIKTLTPKESDLYKETICKVPLWRLVRSSVVDDYLSKKHGFGKRNQRKDKFKVSIILISYLYSSWDLLKLLCSDKKVKIAVFPFKRLQKYGDEYFDKFTDPLTEYLNEETYMLFQKPFAGEQKKPRYNSKKIIRIEGIDYTAKFLGYVLAPITFLFFIKKTCSVFKEAKKIFPISYSFIIKLTIVASQFVVSYFLYYIILRKLKVRKVFFVNREINMPITRASKKLNIETFELQHGITHSYTVLYSTQYNEYVDPNYFLSFGSFWRGNQFGIPIEKIQNLGWAYKELVLKNSLKNQSLLANQVLVISDSVISSEILINAIELAKNNLNIIFNVRLHPQENPNKKLIEEINKLNNIKIVDNSIESSIAILKYKYILGTNSSVLYEAISLNKRVGCFNYGGCKISVNNEIDKTPFFILNNAEDFHLFLKEETPTNYNNPFYSDFNPELFANLVK